MPLNIIEKNEETQTEICSEWRMTYSHSSLEYLSIHSKIVVLKLKYFSFKSKRFYFLVNLSVKRKRYRLFL